MRKLKPFVQVIDRLPLTLESLKNAKIGKVIIKLKESSSNSGERKILCRICQFGRRFAHNRRPNVRRRRNGLRRRTVVEELQSFVAYMMAPNKDLMIYSPLSCSVRDIMYLTVVFISVAFASCSRQGHGFESREPMALVGRLYRGEIPSRKWGKEIGKEE